MAGGPANALEIAPRAHGGTQLNATNAPWLLAETLCYLHHLERAGQVQRLDEERWAQTTDE